ncbi:MAG: response regulator [Chlorobiales bacterium]|nr:response regulator [Chlorobiales bacterium]
MEGTQISPFNIFAAGLLGAPLHFFFYFTFKYLFHLPYENLALRLIATLLCVSVMLKKRLPGFLQFYFSYYWHFAIIFVLPFIFTVNLIMNNFHELWLYWEIFMLFVLIAFVPNWLMFLIDLFIGVIGAVLFYFLSVPHVVLHPAFNIPLYLIVLFCTIVAGYVFSYSNKKGIMAQERNNALQALAGGIAHEMRNPLGQIRYNFDAILQELPRYHSESLMPMITVSGLDKIYQRVAQGQMAVNRGIQVIDMILDEVKEDDFQSKGFAYFSIFALTRKALDEYSYESEQERERIHFRGSDDFMFFGAETMYIFVLFNLIMNALYFLRSYPDGYIAIHFQRGETRNMVYVRDTGPGVSKEILSKLFDPFFTSGRKGGTGLGLSYCKRVMHAFRGDITCNSVQGEFTEFILSFPVVGESDIASFESKLYTDNKALFSGKRLLLVDDDTENLVQIRSYLVPFGVKAEEATSGTEAMRMIDSDRYDLLLVNLDSPDFDCYGLAYRIRCSGNFLPIVVYTKEPFFIVRARVEKSGIQGLIALPLVLSEFLQVLATSLKAKPAKQKGSLSGKVVLVVDDSAINLMVIRSMLKQHGITVLEASNGKEALDKLENHHCDLLLIDIQMPVLDGLEATKRIRLGKHYFRNIPIIGLSGDSSNETVSMAKQSGMNDYLIKPVDSIVLLQKITSLI